VAVLGVAKTGRRWGDCSKAQLQGREFCLFVKGRLIEDGRVLLLLLGFGVEESPDIGELP